MNRSKTRGRSGKFANEPELGPADAAALPSMTGREESKDMRPDATEPIGARPRSEVTGRHDAGSDANETIDGLTPSEEAIRRGAEDTPIGAEGRRDIPVFDRGRAPPKT